MEDYVIIDGRFGGEGMTWDLGSVGCDVDVVVLPCVVEIG